MITKNILKKSMLITLLALCGISSQSMQATAATGTICLPVVKDLAVGGLSAALFIGSTASMFLGLDMASIMYTKITILLKKMELRKLQQQQTVKRSV
jgi:hypothetical protein